VVVISNNKIITIWLYVNRYLYKIAHRYLHALDVHIFSTVHVCGGEGYVREYVLSTSLLFSYAFMHSAYNSLKDQLAFLQQQKYSHLDRLS